MTGRRGIWTAVALCALGSVLVLFSGGRAWLTFPIQHALTIDAPEFRQSGQHALPGGVALGWVALAGALAMVAVRGWARAAVGVLLAVVGVAIVVLDLAWAVSEHSVLMINDESIASGREHVGWPLLSALGGLLVVASGGLAAARGRRWAGLGSSYDAPGAPKEAPVTDKGVWDALDRGDDPTA